MSGIYGVKETKDLFDLGFAILNAGKMSLADGSISIADAPNLMVIFPATGPAIMGAHLVPKELGELDEADVNELLSHAAAKTGELLTSPDLVKKVNACLKAALAIAEGLSAFGVLGAKDPQ